MLIKIGFTAVSLVEGYIKVYIIWHQFEFSINHLLTVPTLSILEIKKQNKYKLNVALVLQL